MSDETRKLLIPARINHLAGLSLAATFVVSDPGVFASFRDWMIAGATKNAEDSHPELLSEDRLAKAEEALREAVDWADREVARFVRSMSL